MDFETGRLARLATGSVTVHAGSTHVLVTCVAAPQRAPDSFAQLDATLLMHPAMQTADWRRAQEAIQNLNTAPLWVDVREHASARGLIPTSYHRRESAPTEKEVITARLIDRALRPTLPRGYCTETQLIAEVLSADGQLDPDTLAINGAATALGLAFQRCFPMEIQRPPLVAAVRIARLASTEALQAPSTMAKPMSLQEQQPRWIIQPSHAERQASDLDLVFVGTSDGRCIALEGEAKAVAPADLVEACRLANAAVAPLLEHQEQILQRDREQVSKRDSITGARSTFWAVPRQALLEEAFRHSGERFEAIYADAPDKTERGIAVAQETARTVAYLQQNRNWSSSSATSLPDTEAVGVTEASLAVLQVSRQAWRRVLQQRQRRVDGRLPDEMRQMEAHVQVLPADTCHGSALVSRGETQVLAVATLGFPSLAKRLDAYGGGSDTKQFYVHYQFPPYCNNQLGRSDALYRRRRREVGHGMLAERALRAVLPNDLWHAVRLEANVLASAGSTSMAAAAAGSLALMDAGLPIAGPVAGISIGGLLANVSSAECPSSACSTMMPLNEKDPLADLLLVDLLGLEDFFGDFDFKIAGTEQGITAMQLDVKQYGLRLDQIANALEKARAVHRAQLEYVLRAALPAGVARPCLPSQAPRRGSWNIALADRGRLLGVGGHRIRELEQQTGCTIQLEENGSVSLWAPNEQALEQALETLQQAMRRPTCGDEYAGRVLQVLDFGAIVEIQTSPGSIREQGLLHRSAFVSSAEWSRVQVGDSVTVRVTQVDQRTGSLRFAQLASTAPATVPLDENENNNNNNKSSTGSQGDCGSSTTL
ncbi:polyribonucleotide nucleotidyltransferase [Cyanidiococcus yangmingshanensis]|uniref:polyribonucleotide nucleotidyltransferase n=1 Tax=Cyanidiococcus yangmingshanensis TaxID=2690220 RepID=A0A7J7ILB6_9RHOD|nr:polyribonucleotide nucleotidyltransferase [Cyanidiococcus yangmingshanensis]